MISLLKKHYNTNSEGFTLIELCIVLIIISVFLSSSLGIFSQYSKKHNINETKLKLDKIDQALALYLENYGSLPCPAPYDSEKGQEEHGFSLDCDEIKNNPKRSSKQYTLAEGREDELVIIGRVPVRTLNLEQELRQDQWKNDIMYAVTLSLTQAGYYHQAKGAITVVDDKGISLTFPEGSVQYTIVSSGYDRTIPDSQNCERKTLSYENCNQDSIFRDAPYTEGAARYDDFINYKVYIHPPEANNGTCDIGHYLITEEAVSKNIIEQLIEKNEESSNKFYPQNGEMVLLCNKRILQQIRERECINLICKSRGKIQRAKII